MSLEIFGDWFFGVSDMAVDDRMVMSGCASAGAGLTEQVSLDGHPYLEQACDSIGHDAEGR